MSDLNAKALEAENARLREALEQCAEYFDNRADAEYFTDSAIPVVNDEMHMLTVVRKALRHARRPDCGGQGSGQ